jgi:hypothetical protein
MTKSVALTALCLICGLAMGQANSSYSVERTLRFIAGDANMRGGLARQPAVSELVAGEFSISVDDLDDDGSREVIVVGSSPAHCGSGGCLTVVLRNAAPGQLEPIFQQNLNPPLGVTRERVNGYRLLAALDDRGRIARGEKPGTPLFGKPLVYAMTLTAATPKGTQPAEAPHPTSTSTSPRPDVLGIRPGKSTIAEVRTALAAVQPAVNLTDVTMQLAGRSASAGITQGPVEVGDGPFLRQIEALTRTFNRGQMCAGTATQGPRSFCEFIRVSFSGPPSAGTAQVVQRDVTFGGNGPTFDNMRSTLTAKYGPPGIERAYGDGGRSRHLTWAWDAAGRPIALAEGHTCANDRGAILAAGLTVQEELRRATVHVDAGCMTTLKVEFGGLNSIVQGFKIVAVDHRAVRDLNALTGRYVDEQVAAKERKAREKAEAIAVPKL